MKFRYKEINQDLTATKGIEIQTLEPTNEVEQMVVNYLKKIEMQVNDTIYYPHTKTDIVTNEFGENVDSLLAKKSDEGHTHDYSPTNHTHPNPTWNDVQNKPDSFPPSTHGHNNATTSASGYMSSEDKVKLDAIEVKSIKRYGIRIDKNDSNPETRVKYIYDAVGMIPARMNLSTGVMNYGSWGDIWFVRDNKPCMLNTNGTVAYYLDRNNHDLKADGTPSDVANINFDGNAMSEFPIGWLYEYQDERYHTVIVADGKYDENYKAYAFTNENGEIKEKIYYPMFDGCEINGKLRSISGQNVMHSKTRQQELDLISANGAGYHPQSLSLFTYRNALLKIMAKNTDGQLCYGAGHSTNSWDGTNKSIPTGSMKNKGQFFGSSNGLVGVKVFFIEHPWGNLWKNLGGLISDANKQYKMKLTPPYNITGEGYIESGIKTNNHGYIKEFAIKENTPLPVNVAGSSTTFECDHSWINSNCYALVGGNWSDGSSCGLSCLNVSAAASTVSVNIGSCLSYIPV